MAKIYITESDFVKVGQLYTATIQGTNGDDEFIIKMSDSFSGKDSIDFKLAIETGKGDDVIRFYGDSFASDSADPTTDFQGQLDFELTAVLGLYDTNVYKPITAPNRALINKDLQLYIHSSNRFAQTTSEFGSASIDPAHPLFPITDDLTDEPQGGDEYITRIINSFSTFDGSTTNWHPIPGGPVTYYQQKHDFGVHTTGTLVNTVNGANYTEYDLAAARGGLNVVGQPGVVTKYQPGVIDLNLINLSHAWANGGKITCFLAGTEIETSTGLMPVELLEAGDLIVNTLGEEKEINWIGTSFFSAEEMDVKAHLQPVIFDADVFGLKSDLAVSKQHRIAISHPMIELLFGYKTAFIPAKNLIGQSGVTTRDHTSETQYVHFSLSEHDTVFANGIACETLLMGENEADLEHAQELAEILPAFERDNHFEEVRYPVLKKFESDTLLGMIEAVDCMIIESASHILAVRAA